MSLTRERFDGQGAAAGRPAHRERRSCFSAEPWIPSTGHVSSGSAQGGVGVWRLLREGARCWPAHGTFASGRSRAAIEAACMR